jgi:hypothetical protein
VVSVVVPGDLRGVCCPVDKFEGFGPAAVWGQNCPVETGRGRSHLCSTFAGLAGTQAVCSLYTCVHMHACFVTLTRVHLLLHRLGAVEVKC